jgi:tRNA pseudouridine55 synthase
MARKKKGEKIDGWLIIDKPLGITSTDVVRRVKRLLQPQKIGHAGTLDPLASGILPLGLGEATKTMTYIVDATKDYEFVVRWGESTETDDSEGKVTQTSPNRPSKTEILKALPAFIGDITQVPPAYSAIKVDGKRAYDLARAGRQVKLKGRTVTIENIELLDASSEDEARFFVHCGKGTYIRSLARDLAKALGTVGHVTFLRRTRVGPFSLNSSISLKSLEEPSMTTPARDRVLSLMTALADIPALALNESEADKIRHGMAIHLPSLHEGMVCLTLDDQPVGLAKAEADKISPVRVFNL